MKRCLACGARFESDGWTCPECGRAPALLGGVPTFAHEAAASDASFDPTGFAGLAEREAGNFWFRARSDLIEWAVRRYFPSARSFFEIGCGTGYVLARLREGRPDLELAGSELYAEGLAFARRRLPDVPLYQMDARRIPFSEEFDVVGAFDVIEHVDEDEQVLAEMREAARPGGGVIVTVPQHPRLWSAVDVAGRHKRRYTRSDLERKLRAGGLEPVRLTSFVTVLLPLMALSRLRDRSAVDYDPLTELRIGRTANAVLKAALDVERQAIKAGLSPPVGGSLLAVARRR